MATGQGGICRSTTFGALAKNSLATCADFYKPISTITEMRTTLGLRGKLPVLQIVGAKPLPTLDPPAYLLDNLLTTATKQSFVLLCELFAKSRNETGKPFLDTIKVYQNLAKLFRLVPIDKPGKKVETRFDDKQEFDF